MIRIFTQELGVQDREFCYLFETTEHLAQEDLDKLYELVGNDLHPELTNCESFLSGKDVVIVGPRLSTETPASSNSVSICHKIGLSQVTRVEKFTCYLVPTNIVREKWIASLFDRMTEAVYETLPDTFESGALPEATYTLPIFEEGKEALRKESKKRGLGLDEEMVEYYYKLFIGEGRDPTNAELFQLAQMNSDHSRHTRFRGKIVIDGVEMPHTLMELVKSPYDSLGADKGSSVIAFHDNASAIGKVRHTRTLVPENPGWPTSYRPGLIIYYSTCTVETHNHPTFVSPFDGAATGSGGRMRDNQAIGRGGNIVAGIAGYMVGNLLMPEHPIPGEHQFEYPAGYATPDQIEQDASDGVSDYGNKMGEPLIAGVNRTFGLVIDGERIEFVKPVMVAGGIGSIDARHVDKIKPEVGMLVIAIGGPAFRIGVGGGAASSMEQGENEAKLDFASVQRGDAQMANRVDRFIRACTAMGEKNPILSIHDQGAGGPSNVATELVHPAGALINLAKINSGDKSLSSLEIWCAEYQERNVILADKKDLPVLRQIAANEGVPLEELGIITGDGYIRVMDKKSGMPINLPLNEILGALPQQIFHDTRVKRNLMPFVIPEGKTIAELAEQVMRLPSVGSKAHLTRKVDRSVGGLVAQQQCCGPLHLPVADFGSVAYSHQSELGSVVAIGEQPIKMLVNPAAGARMAMGEMLTNMAGALTDGLEEIRSQANWMVGAKRPGQMANLYDAASALAEFQIALRGGYVDGGKDSMSMVADVNGTKVMSPMQLQITGYATTPDVKAKVTPDFKKAGSQIGFIDLARGKRRLGGSALAQSEGQIGNESPDVDDPQVLHRGFDLVQELVSEDLILAIHDKSDGGIFTTIAEMALAGGNTGCVIRLWGEDSAAELFNEELGWVIEYEKRDEEEIIDLLAEFGLSSNFQKIGYVSKDSNIMICNYGSLSQGEAKIIFEESLNTVRSWWEATSNARERRQCNIDCAKAQEKSQRHDFMPSYSLYFHPDQDFPIQEGAPLHKVAILREEGSNGDREMIAAFKAAGFDPIDVNMNHLINGLVNLRDFRGLVYVGGFSYGDVFGSGKGWAAVVQHNSKLKEMFDAFYARTNTFSLGICNGFQVMTQLDLLTKGVRLVHNESGRFESNRVGLRIEKSPSIMLAGMEGSVLPVWIAHGEGRVYARDQEVLGDLKLKNLVPVSYVDLDGEASEDYPYNPNGSPMGIAGICSPDGRHLGMMPHPERSFLKQQDGWVPPEWQKFESAPWLRMFQNARAWCDKTK